MIDSLTSLARPEATQPSEPDQNELGKDAFMQLLVAQLENQDPLEPMDSQEMITQLSELTGVEQLTAINDRIGALEIATAGMANTQAADLTGKTVTADMTHLRLGETGDVEGVFDLPTDAASVVISLRDANGREVRALDLGAQRFGTGTFSWDGLDETGARLAPGRYSVSVEARDEDGNPLDADSEITGRVDRVSYQNGYPELVIHKARVMLGDVRSIAAEGASE